MSNTATLNYTLFMFCVLLASGCNAQREELPPWTPMFGDLTTPVSITIAPWEQNYPKYQQKYRKPPHEVTLRMPKNYLGNPLSGGGGKQLMIDIDAGLKEDGSGELEPQKAIFYIFPELDAATRQRAVTKLNNGVSIWVNSSGYHDGENFKTSNSLFVTNKYGLDGYLHKGTDRGSMIRTPAGWKHIEGGREHYFNTTGSTHPSVHLSCGREGGTAGCIVVMVHQNIPIEYFIRRNQLYRWQQFDTAVRTLLDQFIVINEDEKEKHDVR